MRSGVHRWARPPLTLLLVLLASCTYSLSGSNLPSYIKTVTIPNFGNETLEPDVGQQVTNAVTERFIRDGRLKLASEGQAQSLLEGRVVKYENKVYNYSADQTPKDYIVVVTLAVVLRDQVKNRELWKDDALNATAVYSPQDPRGGPSTEEGARQQAIENISGDIVSRTLEQW